jgi:hypothetical protein
MYKTLIATIYLLMWLLQTCNAAAQESISEVNDGPFKVMIRYQELNDSGSVNVDICVASATERIFPHKRSHCFLNGYDFDGLSVKWLTPRVLEVSFLSGRVSQFTNTAFIYPSGPVPEEFHILLCDGCKTREH